MIDGMDAGRLADAWERAPEVLIGHLTRALALGGFQAQREIMERTPTSGAGTLRDSIGLLPLEITATSVTAIVGTSLAYAAPVETGSRPHMPPVEPLADWVRRKLGIADPVKARTVAKAIAWKIKAHGTPAAHMFRDGREAVQPQILAAVEAAVEQTWREIGGTA